MYEIWLCFFTFENTFFSCSHRLIVHQHSAVFSDDENWTHLINDRCYHHSRAQNGKKSSDDSVLWISTGVLIRGGIPITVFFPCAIQCKNNVQWHSEYWEVEGEWSAFFHLKFDRARSPLWGFLWEKIRVCEKEPYILYSNVKDISAHSPLHRIVFIMLMYTKLPVDYKGGLCFSDFSDNIALVLSFHCSFSCGTGKQNKNTSNKRENAKCRVKIVNRNEKFNRRNWSIEINPYTVIQIHLN